MKKKVLMVGEHPFGFTGNSMMMLSILEKLNLSKYNPIVFCPANVPTYNPETTLKIVPDIVSSEEEKDEWGNKKLVQFLSNEKIDILLFVGIDFWRYLRIFPDIKNLKRENKFYFLGIIPYDIHYVRKEWIDFLKLFDHIGFYSEFGYNLTKDILPNTSLFRPPMMNMELFHPIDESRKIKLKKELFPFIPENGFLFGCVCGNQFRKDPQTTLLAFRKLIDIKDNVYFYMHTSLDNGVYNLEQFISDLEFPKNKIFFKDPHTKLPFNLMPKLYSIFDCYVNCSLQEGLSWTVLQSLLCGIPVLISDTTAHKDFNGLPGVEYVVPDRTCYIPIYTSGGQSWIETKGCDENKILDGMIKAIDHKINSNEISNSAKKFYCPSNINDFLGNIVQAPKIQNAFVFAQHSSAGDVLMTTRSFKALKERHPDKKFIYMTQKQYFNILKNNPYIDSLIDWDESVFNKYEICYNPHGDRILKGEFNSLDVKLSDMYHKLLGVEPNDFFIHEEPINIIQLPEHFVIIHSSGQEKLYRTYKNMNQVVKRIPYPTIQIGSLDDLYCPDVTLDLRGKLTFNQTAWLMKRAKGAIVIDSFPSHLAGALGTPVVVLYGPAPSRVTGPVGDPSKIRNVEPDKLRYCKRLTNCWGRFRGCKEPCIDKLTVDEIVKAFQELVG
jgi:glycosyltransferase involved in cell wall biosynthesis